jgi:hypothetical protein
MLRASIVLKVEHDGQVLAEREFSQEDQKLEDLNDMFLNTLFQRMQTLGSDVFDAAEEKLEEIVEEKQRKREEAEAKKGKGKKKPAAKKKAAVKKKEPEGDKEGSDDQPPASAEDV